MKKLFQSTSSCLLLLIAACKKEKAFTSDNTATIQVINAMVDGGAIKLKTNNATNYWSSVTGINYGASRFIYAERKVTLVTVVRTADTATKLLNKSYPFTSKMYTLYITGQLPNIDTLMREENDYPYIQLDKTPSDADSVINVRFVNLSPNSAQVNINILGSTINEASNLGYKGITNFKAYTAKVVHPNYMFEVRDVATNTLLLTYTFNITATNRFKNVALVLKGLQGGTGTNAFGVFTVNYFQ